MGWNAFGTQLPINPIAGGAFSKGCFAGSLKGISCAPLSAMRRTSPSLKGNLDLRTPGPAMMRT
jgi:hypothetical protein